MQAIAYVGQFNNGKLYASGKPVIIPDGQRVVVTFLDSSASASQITLTEGMRIAAQDFLQAMQDLREMGLDEDDNAAIDQLQSGKYKPHFEVRL